MSFQRASWRKASAGMSPPSSRLMRRKQIEVELGGDALRFVVGGHQPLDGLHAVHADQQLRAGAEQRAELAQKVGRTPRHEIADGRAREETELGRSSSPAGSLNGRAKSATTGMDFERRETRCWTSAALCARKVAARCRRGHRRSARRLRAKWVSWSASPRRIPPPPRPAARARQLGA